MSETETFEKRVSRPICRDRDYIPAVQIIHLRYTVLSIIPVTVLESSHLLNPFSCFSNVTFSANFICLFLNEVVNKISLYSDIYYYLVLHDIR
jgi:hypothetical protein